MIQRILVPTDFSGSADTAADAAIELSKKSGARIIFFHVIQVPVDWIGMETHASTSLYKSLQDKEKLYPEARAKIGEVHNKLDQLVEKAKNAGASAEPELAFNQPYNTIVNYAQQIHADLIVMGTHGVSGVRDVVLGSNTQKVVKMAECPVLTVKEGMGLSQIEHIAFASDFHEKMDQSSFWKVIDIANMLNADMHLVYINTPYEFEDTITANEKLERFSALFPEVNVTKHIFNDYGIEKGVMSFCKANNIHMVAMGTHGYKGLKHMLRENISENLVNSADVPVLTVSMHE